jgi:cytosine/adenosine deaminase-related metal-dependent hydrolase
MWASITESENNMATIRSLTANLVHSATGSDVTDVMVDGFRLMSSLELNTADEERILF